MKRGFAFGDPQKGSASSSHLNDSEFHDGEPLPVQSTLATGHEKVVVKTFTEFPAIAASDSISEFAVLLDVLAPPLLNADGQNRVPIDLVFVLDVSGSMFGPKLSLLKSATRFVIDHMLPCDRLSIVTFSTSASRILPLRRMTKEGCQAAKLAVDQLRADSSTDIVAGLNMGAKVLEERRECNPVSSIIFVSDGHDNQNGVRASVSDPPAYLNLLKSSIFCGNRDTFGVNEHSPGQSFPVYAFGVGMDHDPVAMNAISDASGGTFSFLETAEVIPTSFARCIGGLFTVVVQDVRLTVWTASPGVEIKAIPSGRHKSEINSEKNQGTIQVGDLYAEEKKDFLVHVSVPVYSEAKMEEDGVIGQTPLLDIVCYYRNPLSNETEQVEVESLEILRPTALTSADGRVNIDVDRQKNRVRVAESIQKAKEMAEKGNMKEAQEVLTNSRATLLASASAKSGDDELVNQLEAELREITARMENLGLYQQSGRPLVLAGLSAHNRQRATTRAWTARGNAQLAGMAQLQFGSIWQAGGNVQAKLQCGSIWQDRGNVELSGMTQLQCGSIWQAGGNVQAKLQCGSIWQDRGNVELSGMTQLQCGSIWQDQGNVQLAGGDQLQCLSIRESAAAACAYETPMMRKLVSKTNAQHEGTKHSSSEKKTTNAQDQGTKDSSAEKETTIAQDRGKKGSLAEKETRTKRHKASKN